MAVVSLFFQGVAAGFAGNAVSVAVASAIGGAAATGATIGAFLAGPLGSLLLSVGAQALLSGQQQRRPRVEDSRVNVRIENADRWTAWGRCAVGGAVGIFMEHDEAGNFWYIVAHCDGELTGSPTYILDGIQVTLSNGTGGFTAGDVLTDDFCLNSNGDQYDGTGTKVPVWRIYTVSPSAASVYGALPSAFTTAFPDLPADFLGAGVVFSIIRAKALDPADRFKAFRWRGAIGIGEPSVTLVGNFGRFYDPREPGHNINNPATWTASDGNPAIIWAGFRTSQRGKGQPMASVNWTEVEAQADLCDTTVNDRSGNPVPRYRCGIAFPDSKPRGECEMAILAAADAYVALDDTGDAYPEVGYYTAPTVTLTRDRDIMALEELPTDDGVVPLDGVICEYISPDLGWVRVESAPWVNPDRYDGVSEPQYDKITVEACQSHTQAVLLAKAHGLRTQATRRAALDVGLRGVHCIGARSVNLDVDAILDGPHEIVSPVDESTDGTRFRFAVVPIASNRWSLAVGDEGEPPEIPPSLNIDNTLEAAANVVVTAESVATSSGQAVRLKITFDAPTRVDRAFAFRFAVDGASPQVWEAFATNMTDREAVSRIVADGTAYDVQKQTRTAGGRATDWVAVTTITATADPTAPSALVSASATGGVGQLTANWTTANSVRQASVAIYTNTVNTKPATPTTIKVSAANVTGSETMTGLSPGTYYVWLAPRNGSGVEGTTSGSYSVTVT